MLYPIRNDNEIENEIQMLTFFLFQTIKVQTIVQVIYIYIYIKK